jgi:hypothetical protein
VNLYTDPAAALPEPLRSLPPAQRESVMLAAQLLGAVCEKVLPGRYLVIDANGYAAVDNNSCGRAADKFFRSLDWGTQS